MVARRIPTSTRRARRSPSATSVTQVDDRRVGLRFVRVRDGRLYLNGHLLQLRGASIQEDLPGRGPALRDQDVDTIVNDLERLGANVTRAQYPLDERVLERLDEKGILVWSQAPVYHEDVALQKEPGRRAALEKVRTTVLHGPQPPVRADALRRQRAVARRRHDARHPRLPRCAPRG